MKAGLSIFAAFCAFVFSATLARANPYSNSFESPVDLSGVNAQGATISLVTGQGVTDGNQALRVEFAKGDWPQVDFRPDSVWDWSGDAFLFDVTNPGAQSAAFGIRIDDDPTADGWNHSWTGEITLPARTSETVCMPLSGVDAAQLGMRGLPPVRNGFANIVGRGAGRLDLEHVVRFQFFMHSPGKPTALIFDHIRTAPQPAPDLNGVVDQYGQYAREDWPGKVHALAEFQSQEDEESRDLRSHPPLASLDSYGGWRSGPQLNATGYFRTQKEGKFWSLVDPDGRLFFSLGMDTITEDESSMVTGREYMYSWLPAASDPLGRFCHEVQGVFAGPTKNGTAINLYGANLWRKYGPHYETAWRDRCLQRLPSWGFNTIGNWSSSVLETRAAVPYVATASISGDFKTVSSGEDYWSRMPDPFDPKFAENAERSIGPLADRVKDDPYCIGYFVDNERSWGGGTAPKSHFGLAYGAMDLDEASSPAKTGFIAALQAKYGTIDGLNAAWTSGYASWDALSAPTVLNPNPNTAMSADLSAFVSAYARQYFTVVRNCIRAHDPNHLYLGCRFAWYTPEAVDEAARICDVVSFNVYATELTSTWDFLKPIDRPCMIGEFHFGALDRGMFHGGLVPVANQKARGDAFVHYVESVLDHPDFVGCHWFQFADEPLIGRWFDGENYNIGFVSVVDHPYPDMVAASRRISGELYTRRFAKSNRQ
jgi:hypothetical protein